MAMTEEEEERQSIRTRARQWATTTIAQEALRRVRHSPDGHDGSDNLAWCSHRVASYSSHANVCP